MATKGLHRHKRRLGSKDPRVTSSQAFNFHESSWRAQTDATKQWQEHKCSNLSLSNPTKTTNGYGGRREKEQRRTQQIELQDLYPKGSPHLEERWIGRNVDLDLLSLFPQRYARIMGGIEERQALQGQQWWEREKKMCGTKVEEGEGYL